jgi:hypothetical protein
LDDFTPPGWCTLHKAVEEVGRSTLREKWPELWHEAESELRRLLCGTPPLHDDAVPTSVITRAKIIRVHAATWARPYASRFFKFGRARADTQGIGFQWEPSDGPWEREEFEGPIIVSQEALSRALSAQAKTQSEPPDPSPPAAAEERAAGNAKSQAAAPVEVDPYRSGFPGRPTIRHAIEAHFQERCTLGEVEDSLTDEAAALRLWAEENHPGAPIPSRRAIENRIRSAYRKYQQKGPGLPS